MLDRVRFEHGFIPELGMFKITSPDIKGFFITAKTEEEAEREALAMVALIRARQGNPHRSKLAAIAFEAG